MHYFELSTNPHLGCGGICEVLTTDGTSAEDVSDQFDGNLIAYWDETHKEFGDLINIGGGGRPLVVSRRCKPLLSRLSLPDRTRFHELSILGNEDEVLTVALAVRFHRVRRLLSVEEVNRVNQRKFSEIIDPNVPLRLSLETPLPQFDIISADCPLCICTGRFRDAVEDLGFVNFQFKPIEIA